MNHVQKILSIVTMSGAASLAAAEIPFQSGETVAFLGDSITQNGTTNPCGYVNLVMNGLKHAGIEAKLLAAGVSGNTSRDMLKRVDKDVIAKKPQWMFLSCGVNDAPNGMDNPGVPLEEYKKNITAILDKCKAAKINVIVLTATPVVEEPEHVANKNLIPYNEYLRTLEKERGLPVIDLNKRMNQVIDQKPDKQKRTLTVDGTHMSPYGDILLAYTILQQLGMKPELLHESAQEWLNKPDGWNTKMTLQLSVNQMEALQKILPDGMTVEQWVNEAIREKLK